MRMIAGFLSALMAVGACGLDSGGNLGREWNSLDATESSFIFTAPGLDTARKRYMHSSAQDYSHTTEIGIWSSPSSLFPKAQLVLQKLAPLMYYTYGIRIERNIERLNFLTDKNPSIGERKTAINNIGEIVYRKFTFDDFECIAFGQNFGDTVHDSRILRFSDLLTGFYCGDRGEKLSSDMILQVVRSIGIKGVGDHRG